MSIKTLLALKKKYRVFIYLFLIILVSFYLRTFNVNWDNNHYFHPDERAIIMYASPLRFPTSIQEFLSIQSPLNPHFFAYGNLPLYLVKFCGSLLSGLNPVFSMYGGLHIVGRVISASADTGTVVLAFLIGSLLFSKRAGLIAATLYCFSVFPIQVAHFYAVDALLTFFMTATILSAIYFSKHPNTLKSVFLGSLLGLSLATKVSAAIIILPITIPFFVHIFKKGYKKSAILAYAFLVLISSVFIFFSTQPYALIDFSNFLQQVMLQSQMSNNPFLFPYTLQYVGKIPYIYELKNIFHFGLGPIIFTLCAAGIYFLFIRLKRGAIKLNLSLFLIFFYTALYFFVFGRFAVGWMRYMLPVYPMLSLFGGYFLSEIVVKKIEKKYLTNYLRKKVVLFFFLISVGLYPLSFLSIYNYPNTREQASNWINKNIPPGSSLAVEHWDDALPVYGMERYLQLTLPLYEPDTDQKWEQINTVLHDTQYIIIASNRLYVPLQKLTNCKELPPDRCYPRTAAYYQKLFNNQLGFTKVAEFTDYPKVPFLNLELKDDSADESFTVYDHPKIMIFKKD